MAYCRRGRRVGARALAFAAEKHRSQRRKGRRLAGIEDAELIAAAILHDTVEDTQNSPAELAARFGPKISAIVAEITDDKSLLKAERKWLQIEHATVTFGRRIEIASP